MKKTILLVALAAVALAGCKESKSEKEIAELVEEKVQQRLDKQKLEDTEAKLAEAEAKLAAAEKKASAAEAKSAAPASSSKNILAGADFAWLSQRRVTLNDIRGLSSQDLRILRNAIYARHGRKFKTADMRAYFSQFSWYRPLYDEVQLTNLEQANVAFIKSYE